MIGVVVIQVVKGINKDLQEKKVKIDLKILETAMIKSKIIRLIKHKAMN